MISDYDQYLYQQEIWHEQMEDFYATHCCGACQFGLFKDGDVDDEVGICEAYTTFKQVVGHTCLDHIEWVASNEYRESCWNYE